MRSTRRVFALLTALILGQAAMAQADILSVTGWVVGPEGVPIRGARVDLVPAREPDVPEATATADGGGRFVLQVPRPGVRMVVVRAEGFVPMAYPLVPLAEDAVLPAVTLPKADRVRVRVEDPEGRPIAGARVRAVTDWSWGDWFPAERQATTGGDGTVDLPRAPGEPLRLWALAPGFPVQSGPTVSGSSATLRLVAGSRQTLRLVDPRGDRRPGEVVRDVDSDLVLGRTDPSGELVVDAPAQGSWGLQVETSDGLLAPYKIPPLPASVSASGDRRVRRTLHLPPSAPVRGRALDAETGKPIAGAWIWLDGNPSQIVRSGPDGAWHIAAAEGTWVWLGASAKGRFPDISAVHLEPGRRNTGLEIALSTTPTLLGLVGDKDGSAVDGVEVKELSSQSALRKVRTSREGIFRLPGLVPGKAYTLLLLHEGFAPASTVARAPTYPFSAPRPVRLGMDQGRTLFGRAVDEDGKPVAGAEVEWSEWKTGTSQAVATGRDGRFELLHQLSGSFNLRFRADGFARLSQAIELQATDPDDLGTFHLQKSRALSGRVTDAHGRPVAGATVWNPSSSGQSDATTGEDGLFELRNLDPAQPVRFSVCAPATLTSWFESEKIPEERVEIVLQPAASLSGRVMDESGLPAEGVRLEATLSGQTPGYGDPPGDPCPSDNHSGGAVSGEDGRFTISQLQPGWFSVSARKEGYRSATSERVRIEPGQSFDDLQIHLERGAVLQGRILDGKGDPVPGARIELDGKERHKGTSDTEGVYRLVGLAPGYFEVTAEHPDRGKVREAIKVQEGENSRDLRLTGPTEVRGRVVGPGGAPVEGAQAYDGNASALSAADGSFVLRAAHDARRLTVKKQGFASAYRELHPEGDPIEVEVRLTAGGALTGRVLGLASLEELHVSGSEARSYFSASASLDLQGEYRMINLAPGTWRVTASAGDRVVHAETEIHEGEESRLDLTFPPMSEVRGRAFGPDGAPLPGAQILFQTFETPVREALTTEDGSFAVELEAGTYQISLPDFFEELPEPSSLTVGDLPVDDLEIRLPPPSDLVVSGRILGLAEGEIAMFVTADLANADDAPSIHGALDQDGGYRIAGLRPGLWAVAASFYSEPLWAGGSRSVTATVNISKGTSETRLDLDFLIGSLTLSGRLTGNSFQDSSPIHVQLLREGGGRKLSLATSPSPLGRFRFDRLQPDRYLLQVQAGGRSIAEQWIDLASDREIEIDLQPAVPE